MLLQEKNNLRGEREEKDEEKFVEGTDEIENLYPSRFPNSGMRSSWAFGLVVLIVVPCYMLVSFGNIQSPMHSREPATPKIVIATDKNYQDRLQNDPSLIGYIRTLVKSPSTKPYRLFNSRRKHFTSMEQSKYVGDLYGPGKRNGFFVEVGALDGEQSSSTLYLERELGFKGLLIEPNPTNYIHLIRKERKAYLLNAALSPKNTSAELLFTGSGQQGHITDVKTRSTVKVKSFPFFAIMQAVNVSFIDVFNLDIEGFEFKVLKTIPFDRLKFGILIVEHMNIPETDKKDLLKFMKDHGFVLTHRNSFDYIFGDPDYLSKLPGWKS